ncbi:MAG: type II toxin-antitoxin system RelE/ParE family toxin [Phycisphaerales bacterium]|nr:type II toxin-antitoxin system RelE/ParE family toxin [Phycisphaerales bacterium]
MEVRRYLTDSGKDVVGEWLASLSDARARAKVATRIARLEAGNFGDCRPVGDGVWELRIDWGPGYRVYYAVVGAEVVLLLCCGDKRRQAADIRRAAAFLKDYRRRTTAS